MIKNISTKNLIEELRGREGVDIKIAGPYQNAEIKANGPAIILTIID